MEPNKHLIDLYVEKFYRDNARLTSGQKVLVISDDRIDRGVSTFLAEGAKKITPHVTCIYLNDLPPVDYRPEQSLVDLAMGSDVIVAPTSRSFYHTSLIRDACAGGAIFFAMTGADLETLYKGAATADFVKLEPGVLHMAQYFTQSNEILLTTDKGTRFSASIEGRVTNAETGMGQKGKPSTFPDIEINTSIIEASGNGRIVIDGSISGYGVLDYPITLVVENGKITGIEGGSEAEEFRKRLDVLNDENMFQIAEIGIGLNPEGCVRGVIIEDESTLGTAHIGIGNNLFMGGENAASSHIDLVFTDPKIILDGKLVIDGTLHYF
jgi:leucyl aminopeptidase (aminopeptidase T)